MARASPERKRTLPWCTCVSASARQSRAQCRTREGLILITSGNNNTGYKGVTFCPEQQGRKVYQLRVTAGGKMVSLGYFATAEQAALFYARREAGRDTS